MVNGKSKPIRKGGFKTKKEAQVAAAEIETDLRKGFLPILTPIPFVEYFETWINLYKKDIAESTLNSYNHSLKVVSEYFEDKTIQEITRNSYQDFLNEYGKNRTKMTTIKLNNQIRACVKDAVDDGYIRIDFTRNIVVTGNKGKRPDEKYLDYKESTLLLKELYKKLDNRLSYYLLLLALTSGMRYGELIGLTRKDFDF